MLVRKLAATFLGLCGAAVLGGTAFALDFEAARSLAIEELKAKLETPLGSPTQELSASALHDPASARNHVTRRLDAVFGLVVAEEAAGPAVRLPRPRPAEADELVALAYADTKAGGGSSGLTAIEALVEKHAAANGVPADLAHALVQVESSYNPKATGARGEIGLLQIKPATARGIGYKGPPKSLYDAETNLAWGLKYLGRAHELSGGDTCGTLLRYNAGLDAKRASTASSRFCAKVKAVMAKRA